MKSKWIGVVLMLDACLAGAAQAKPNILWITGEDMSAKWLGCYGNKPIKTLNFDKFAKEGFLYTRCFAQAREVEQEEPGNIIVASVATRVIGE
jgi:hypothetical protein